MKSTVRWSMLVFCQVLMFSKATLKAEEGMWTFDNIPVEQLKDRYGFVPTKEWLDHLRLASVRFNDGGSGSFISPTGLVLTNQHVARGQLQKLSTPQRDFVKDGFLASSTTEELRCPDLELNLLISMQDVTAQVQAAANVGTDENEKLDRKKAIFAKLEKESLDATGLRSDIVRLYLGSEYWLYRYKKYTDVRLVFAPENQTAFFGGDLDNFTFPRHDLDMAIFRVYENGKPVLNHEYLKWNPRGAADGELVFVSGHPSFTNRMDTLATFEFMRDHGYPEAIPSTQRTLEVIRRYAARGDEERQQVSDLILGMENSLKSIRGQNDGINTPRLMLKKASEEKNFRTQVAANPLWQKEFGTAWDETAAAHQRWLEKKDYLTHVSLGGNDLPYIALKILRYVTEVPKPDGERLDGYHDAGLESLRFELFSSAPVYLGLEEVMLADSLKESLEVLGADHPFTKAALNGHTPEAVARNLINSTRTMDPAFRKQLVDGGASAVNASSDPMILWVRKLDPFLRERRKWSKDNLESAFTAADEKIGKARFAVYGRAISPDATSTLRLSYGTVKGYPMNGTLSPSKTTFFGLYDRATSFDFKAPFQLTKRYLERKDKLDLSKPLNFVTTCDIAGGNSGSPVVNRDGEIVGLIFDNNIEGLVGSFIYDDTSSRSIAVHTAAMTEALTKLYDAEFLVKEMTGR